MTAGTQQRAERLSHRSGARPVEPSRPARRADGLAHLLTALSVLVPLCLTRPGQVVADTKQYLYLDPLTMIEASTSLWDPDWAGGTVTHQSIGYLWPMGPWFAAADILGLPMWLAQRLWLAGIIVAAMWGVLALGRLYRWRPEAAVVGAVFYGLAPYALPYATRMSALILAWAGFPWLLAAAVRSVRRTSGRAAWIDPAVIALLGTTIGAVNASSLIFVGVAVIAWYPYAVFSARELSPAEAVATMTRIGVCLVAVSLWWAVPLVVQGQWGTDVLRFSETLEVVASGSPASEAWRGLGYWVFYGGDRTGPWVSAAVGYTQNPLLIAVTFLLAVVGFVALLTVRWRHQTFMLGLAVLSLVLIVGLHPYHDPSPLGSVVTSGAAESTLALALRSSPRAAPLYLLAVACSLAAGVDAAFRLQLRWRRAAAAGLVVLSVGSLPPLWTGRYVGAELARDEEPPAAWVEVAAHLDDSDPNGRALILPGSDFSAHRWGNTIDHVLPGLTERPVMVRELIPYGSEASADLLIALDRRAQERLLEPAMVGPIARLLGVGSVVVQSDLEFERYRTPRPDDFWRVVTADEAGLAEPVAFGTRTPNTPSEDFPMLDEIRLQLPTDLEQPPAVAVLPVEDPLGIVRLRPDTVPLVVVGDAEGLVEAAGAGLVDPDRVVLYEAALDDDGWRAAIDAGATLVVTDSNRSRARRWRTVRDNLGLTESVTGDGLRPDSSDARLDVFPDAPATAHSWTHHLGVQVRSSTYGNPISYHPEDRAAHAVDGDPTTAWRVGTFSEAAGEWLELTWPDVQQGSVLRVRQPVTGNPNRTITDLAVSVDGGPPVPVVLDAASTSSRGQEVPLPVEEFRTIRLTVLETSAGRRPGYGGLSGVGFAEVSVDGVDSFVEETVATPVSWLRRPVEPGAANNVRIVLSRERIDASSPTRDDPETRIDRLVELPVGGDFTVRGSVRLSARTDDPALNAAIATLLDDGPGTGVDDGANWEVSGPHLPGPPAVTVRAAIDDDPVTAWRPPLGPQVGVSMTLEAASEQTISEVEVEAIVGPAHSVPTTVELTNEAGEVRTIDLPLTRGPSMGDHDTASVPFEPLSGRRFTVTVVAVDRAEFIDWYSTQPVEQPIGIASLRLGDAGPVPASGPIDTGCRTDLLSVDGTPVPARLSGDLSAALAGEPIDLIGCVPTEVGAGSHRIVGSDRAAGLVVDRLVLDRDGPAAFPPVPDLPSATVTDQGRGSHTIEVGSHDEPLWLVLGESYNGGWGATVDGADLGPPILVDGAANGWLLEPSDEPVTVALSWRPNGLVRVAQLASALAVAVCLVLIVRGRRPVAEPSPATLESPWERGPLLHRTPPALLLVVAALAVGLLVKPILAPVVVLLLVVAATRFGRRAVLVAGPGGLLVAGAYVTVMQLRYGAPHDGAWPHLWHRAHLLGLLGIVALIVVWLSAAVNDHRSAHG